VEGWIETLEAAFLEELGDPGEPEVFLYLLPQILCSLILHFPTTRESFPGQSSWRKEKSLPAPPNLLLVPRKEFHEDNYLEGLLKNSPFFFPPAPVHMGLYFKENSSIDCLRTFFRLLSFQGYPEELLASELSGKLPVKGRVSP
jgi:hypothetical protein